MEWPPRNRVSPNSSNHILDNPTFVDEDYCRSVRSLSSHVMVVLGLNVKPFSRECMFVVLGAVKVVHRIFVTAAAQQTTKAVMRSRGKFARH